MKRSITFYIISTILLLSCNSGAPAADNPTSSSGAKDSKDVYFEFNVDGGKTISIPAEDVLARYKVNDSGGISLKIFSGKDGASTGQYDIGLNLTIPEINTLPSSTPNGSPDFALNISQGSVYLTNYPSKNYGFTSFNMVYHETIIPDAIIVTANESDGDKNRIISGTVKVKTYAEPGNTSDPLNVDHNIEGKFKVRAEPGS